MDSACNFSTDRLQVNYNPITTSPDRIIEAVKKLGYRAAEPDESRDALERRREFIRFAISAFLTMNIMMLSYALYSGFFIEFSPGLIGFRRPITQFFDGLDINECLCLQHG